MGSKGFCIGMSQRGHSSPSCPAQQGHRRTFLNRAHLLQNIRRRISAVGTDPSATNSLIFRKGLGPHRSQNHIPHNFCRLIKPKFSGALDYSKSLREEKSNSQLHVLNDSKAGYGNLLEFATSCSWPFKLTLICLATLPVPGSLSHIQNITKEET